MDFSLWQELRDCRKDKETSGLSVELPNEANLMHWRGTLKGPAGTPYEGGIFYIDIRLPPDYPFVPPKVCCAQAWASSCLQLHNFLASEQMKYETKIWHPNISSETGAICLDILKNEWSPALTVRTGGLCCSSNPRVCITHVCSPCGGSTDLATGPYVGAGARCGRHLSGPGYHCL